MEVVTKLHSKDVVTIRIREGNIVEAKYEEHISEGTTEKVEIFHYQNNFQAMLEIWLKEISKADVKKFKEITLSIKKGKPEIYSYCESILEKEQERIIRMIRSTKAEYSRRLNSLERELKEYTL